MGGAAVENLAHSSSFGAGLSVPLHTGTKHLEAQVELQGEKAYRQHQARYAASCIRTLWLVTHELAALRDF